MLKHSCYIPNSGISFKQLQFFLCLVLQLRTILGEGLELIDILVDNIPQPLKRQGEVIGSFQILKEITVVLPRFESLFERWRRTRNGIDMTVVQLLVQDQKHLIIVYKRCDCLTRGPKLCSVVGVSQLSESRVIERCDLVNIF